jgi:uncharacterized secreted protein with C-terminal beta-propeller domain
MRKGIIGVVLVGAMVAAGFALAVVSETEDPQVARASGLVSYESCDALLAAIQTQALAQVGPYGLDGGYYPVAQGRSGFAEGDVVGVDDSASGDGTDSFSPPTAAGETSSAPPTTVGEVEQATEDLAESSTGDEGTAEFSTTNVQEAGVDEPDLAKTDGQRLVAVAGGELRVFDVSGDEPVQQGSVALPAEGGFELLVQGDRALILGTTYGGGVPIPIEGDGGTGAVEIDDPDVTFSDEISSRVGGEVTQLAEVDLSDPAEPVIVHSATLAGRYVTARQIGEHAQVVTATPAPDLGFVYPSDGSSSSEDVAEQANRRVIEQSTIGDWLPQVAFDTGEAEQAVACEQVEVPEDPSGFGTATVVSIDLGQPLAVDTSTSVLGGSDVVYASQENLYVATTAWPVIEDQPDLTDDSIVDDVFTQPVAETNVHRFALPADGTAAYEATGTVPGRMLSQFSFSEFDGHLRVATTVDETSGPVSQLTVLAVDELREVGAVGDIGQGEELYAVRMIGDVGYAITFFQTDPLFTLDLSDPADPQVVGELEIPGYSAYLHPVSDDLLLGIGQAGTEDGTLTGTQVSLFDVSDPASPQRIQQYEVAGGSSEAEYDHRAFLYWADTQLAVLPLEVYGFDAGPLSDFVGAIGLRVTEEAIDEVGTMEHEPRSPIRRTLVVGDTVFTLSDTALQGADLTTLEPTSELAF